MIYWLNQLVLPTEYDDIKRKVETLVAAGEVDLEEIKPEFERGIMLLDLILRTIRSIPFWPASKPAAPLLRQ